METSTGSAQLRANFTPEIIDLRWYNNNTLLNVTSTSSDTCTYDTAIPLPANPTKPGYKFKGWKVRPEYDFTTLPTDHTAAAGYGLGATGYYVQRVNGTATEGSSIPDVSGFTDLNRNEWKSIFSWGTIYGMAKCSSIQGTSEGEHGTPNDTYGKYCWCRATGYIPNGQSTKYNPLKPTSWTFNSSCEVTSSTGNLVNICHNVCAGRCAIFLTYAQLNTLLNGLLR